MPRAEKGLQWNGKQIYKAMTTAAAAGVDEVMEECVKHASQEENHPNWKNRTGTAEGSVTVVDFAKLVGFQTVGVWGSKGVNYAIYLEGYHGPWLRDAGDKFYPGLEKKVAKHYAKLRRLLPA